MSPHRLVRLGLVASIVALAGCGSDAERDAGSVAPDAGGADAGTDAAIDGDGGDDAGPTDAGPLGDPLDRYRSATIALDAAYCACDYDGFTDPADCAAFFDNPALDACDDLAYEATVASSAGPIACLAAAREDFSACAAAAGCDDAMLDACALAESRATAACPDVPDAFFETSEACVEGMVGGTPSPCPENASPVSTTGPAVFRGSTLGAGSDAPPQSCATACEPDTADRAFAWTAPTDGTFVFDTAGSVFDTVLSLNDGCEGAELACSDDARRAPDIGLRSRVRLAMTAGQVVTIHVKGCTAYDAGELQVNIELAP